MSAPNELSFLPDDYLERKAQRRTNAICAVLFLIVMVAIGAAFTITERTGRDVEREHSDVEKKYTEAAKRIQLKQQLEEKQATMEKQAELSASLLEKVPRSFILARVTNSLPAGVSLLDLSMDSKLRGTPNNAPAAKSGFDAKRSTSTDKKAPTTPIQQAKVYDVSLKITGIAFTDVQVAQFIGKLNQAKIFKDVNLLISDEYKDSDTPMRKFQVEASIDPSTEVTSADADKPRTAAVEIKENNP
jgi:Tfp pilus assembly protein PilN